MALTVMGSSWGPESNGEYTHPQLSPKQKAAFAMSVVGVAFSLLTEL
jgi:hypothetical protein